MPDKGFSSNSGVGLTKVPKVVHASTVHSATDNRVFRKECKSAAKSDFDVVLIARHPRSEVIENVSIVGIPTVEHRLSRMTRMVWKVTRLAMQQKPAIIHFHDPELIPAGLIWTLLGISVVYDVHEDYITSIRQKSYLGIFRECAVFLTSLLECGVQHVFRIVIAERYYQERFPTAVQVLNYPDLDLDFAPPRPNDGTSRRLLFTGGSHPQRGSLHHANLVNLIPDIELHLVGLMRPDFRKDILKTAGANNARIHIDGDATLVPFERIVARYREGNWLAGLAIFPPHPDNMRKELTKLFEYMAAGLPIICSDFPVWKELVEGNQCGLCVPPDDNQAVKDAVIRLMEEPNLALRMGFAGRKASRKYTWQSQAEKLVGLYQDILTRRATPSSKAPK